MSFCCLVLKAPTPVNFLGKLGCLGPSPVTSAPCLGQEYPPHVGAGVRPAPVWASLLPHAVDWGKALVPSLRLYLQSGHNDPFFFKWECRGRLLCILKGLAAPLWRAESAGRAVVLIIHTEVPSLQLALRPHHLPWCY